MVSGSCKEIPERAKVPRAETQRRGVDKENRAFIYFKPLRLCVSARDCKFFLTFPEQGFVKVAFSEITIHASFYLLVDDP